jgi:pentatricopeptide repeat protein
VPSHHVKGKASGERPLTSWIRWKKRVLLGPPSPTTLPLVPARYVPASHYLYTSPIFLFISVVGTLSPPCNHSHVLLDACYELQKGMAPQKATEVFDRMRREGIRPSVVSYSALISAAEKGGQWKLALEGFPGNVVAYSACISALAKGQQWERALELFREIQTFGGSPSIVTYNATVTALEKGMQWELALGLFEEMKMRNLPITVVSYGGAISACDKGLQYRQW